MNLRKSQLPAGWYPRTPTEIEAFLKSRSGKPGAGAAVAPHAGWYYSGRIAAEAVSALLSGGQKPDTVIIIGGHLPEGCPPLLAMEDGVQSPLGTMMMDREFRECLSGKIDGRPDIYRDNTVEVLLPMVHYFFPDAGLVWLRLPAERRSYDTGVELATLGLSLGRKLAVLGSTDLTHYGFNYGFSPRGGGQKALDWVRQVNDSSFIEAVKTGDPALVFERAEADKSACSVGAVLAVLGYARGMGLGNAELLAYATSAEAGGSTEIPDSFVGYGAFAWYPAEGGA
ncbi:MAG: AmmeMemoRadiSam system protein B [Treponema sp.]|jgi:AmmeMemoRadiSam system protein B|nr:AmmeMemoRadiSam system protein B [Treponema sp.]